MNAAEWIALVTAIGVLLGGVAAAWLPIERARKRQAFRKAAEQPMSAEEWFTAKPTPPERPRDR